MVELIDCSCIDYENDTGFGDMVRKILKTLPVNKITVKKKVGNLTKNVAVKTRVKKFNKNVR